MNLGWAVLGWSAWAILGWGAPRVGGSRLGASRVVGSRVGVRSLIFETAFEDEEILTSRSISVVINTNEIRMRPSVFGTVKVNCLKRRVNALEDHS